MLTVNIHEAKTQLSKLIAMAIKGQPFIIAKAGKPMVKVEAIGKKDDGAPLKRGLGSLEGQFDVPDDIDTMFKDDIEEMFYGGKLNP